MCAKYHPITARDRLLGYFGVQRPDSVPPPEMAFPLVVDRPICVLQRSWTSRTLNAPSARGDPNRRWPRNP